MTNQQNSGVGGNCKLFVAGDEREPETCIDCNKPAAKWLVTGHGSGLWLCSGCHDRRTYHAEPCDCTKHGLEPGYNTECPCSEVKE